MTGSPGIRTAAGADAIRPPEERPALETATTVWTREEVLAGAEALAAHLPRPEGRGPARVGHGFDLTPEAVVAVHAIERAGAILAPMHLGWTDARRRRITSALDLDAVLVAPGRSWPGRWDRSSLPIPGFGPVDLLTRPDSGARGEQGTALPEGTGVILSTSGTGGRPRAVCHSREALRANAAAANRRAAFDETGAWLATLAWAHVGGLAIVIRAAEAGGRVVCGPRRFDAAAVSGAIERHRVTHVSVVPVMLERLLGLGAELPASLRCILVGGAATPPDLLARALEANWPVALTYGLTEAGSQVATAMPEHVREGRGPLGRLLDGFELRLASDGEIEVRGPSLMLGYVEGPQPFTPDGWLSTGDFGAPDGSGSVIGRRASRIVTGGTNVDPEEVEALLRQHPRVRAACVVGAPDETWGEVVTAVIVPHAFDRVLEGQLDDYAREALDSARRPRAWRFVDALPRTPSDKIDRAAVRASVIAERRQESDEPPAEPAEPAS